MERRLGKLEVIYRRRRRVPTRMQFAMSALSPMEVVELGDLLREPARHEDRMGVASYAMLSPAEMARLEHLWSRAREIA
jgi:hypothetical protein